MFVSIGMHTQNVFTEATIQVYHVFFFEQNNLLNKKPNTCFS